MAKVTPETIADLVAPRGIRLSPDGRQVVYAVRVEWNRKGEHDVQSLWIADVGRPNSARQLTSGRFSDSDPQFSPDGRSISFLSDRHTAGKLSAIFLLPLTGAGEALPLGPTDAKAAIGEHAWSPDGRYIAFTSPDEQPDKGNDDAKTYGQDWAHARLRLADVHSKEIRVLAAPDAHVTTFTWSPDGQSIAYIVSKSPEIDHVRFETEFYTLSLERKSAKHLCHFMGSVCDLTWHGEDLFWAAKWEEKSHQTSTALWSLSTTQETPSPRRVAYGENDCISGLRRCGSKLVVSVLSGLWDYLDVFDSGERIFAERVDISSGWDACFKDNKPTVAVIKADSPSCREVHSITDSVPVQLSQHSETPPESQPGRVILVETEASDGTPIDGIVYVPDKLASAAGPHPAVVVVHGGPYHRITRGIEAIWSWTPWLLSLGYVVIHPNYRGGAGHGRAFAEAVVGDASQSYQDIVTLVKNCIADGLVDEQRVAISGWSQGGYLSYLAITRDDTFHFAAAVAGAGVSCWDTLVMSTDIPTYEAALAGAAPWLCSSDDTTGRRGSPIWCMQNIRTPLLILHGEEDARVPLSQALGFHRGMLARGKHCELVTYPREGHGIPKLFERAHYVHELKTIGVFLEKHLGAARA